ncbi:MAG: ATP-binding protein [Betaproteobacteria bacterium]|nr:ATP-binding protein [Betaproteobacteria bacterium]
MLGEALTNTVLNAIEYGREKGRATVRCGVDAEGAFLEVEDDGPGIPVAERDRVLERFYRIPGTTGIGSGLGLAIVREIVQQHGGVVVILDGEAGRGCRVRMAFPIMEDAT